MKLTDDETVSLKSGRDVWHTFPIERLGIKSLTLHDGSHGVRDGSPSRVYPNLNLMACSWDRSLLKEMGENLGDDAAERGTDVLLAPGINIKRNPLCGRNFEYLSEDPLLAGELAAAYVNGVQSRNVAACVKHYCCNNRENGRFFYSVNVDERALRDVYIKPFEIVIKKCAPRALMTAYNKINGVYASNNKKLLDILREDLGFRGVTVSDWGGVDDRVKAYAAGLDLEMPGSDGKTHASVLPFADDYRESAERIIALTEFCAEKKSRGQAKNLVRLAEESFVLLKNDGILPLKEKTKIAVVGAPAMLKISQGGGCANVAAEGGKSAYESLSEIFAADYFDTPSVELADYGAVVVFVGDEPDSEGYDRADLNIDTSLLEKCAAINENTVAVLVNGGAVETEKLNRFSKAVLETYYAGEAFGAAVARVLSGRVNPSGRLAESFVAYDDVYCRGEENKSEIAYIEGENVGYRYYLAHGVKTAYPFGYGLSYTRFDYSGFVFDKEAMRATVAVKNTGGLDGKEVVQIYCGNRLIAFDKIHLARGETKTANIDIDPENVKVYDPQVGRRIYPKGKLVFSVNADAETPLLKTEAVFVKYDRYSTVGEVIKSEKGARIVKERLKAAIVGCIIGDDENYPFDIKDGRVAGDKFFARVAEGLQLRQTVYMSNNKLSEEDLRVIINELNA